MQATRLCMPMAGGLLVRGRPPLRIAAPLRAAWTRRTVLPASARGPHGQKAEESLEGLDQAAFEALGDCYGDDDNDDVVTTDRFAVGMDLANLGTVMKMMGGAVASMRAQLADALNPGQRAALEAELTSLQESLKQCGVLVRTMCDDMIANRADAPEELLELPRLDAFGKRKDYEDAVRWVYVWRQVEPMLMMVLRALEAELQRGYRTQSCAATAMSALPAVKRLLVAGSSFAKVLERYTP